MVSFTHLTEYKLLGGQEIEKPHPSKRGKNLLSEQFELTATVN
jgi:hypothetical protein